MMTYILTFFAGMTVGVTTLLLHQYSVKRAVNAEMQKARNRYNMISDENDRLRGRINELTRDRTNSSSYRQGLEDGVKRGKDMQKWEVLESTLSGNGKRTVQVGGAAK